MFSLGQEPEVLKLTGEDLRQKMVDNLLEEVAELDPSSSSFYEELADVKQATEDLLTLVDGEEVERLRLEKREERGDFSDGFYISKLVLDSNDEWVEYYRREPEKYKEEILDNGE